MGRKLPLTYEWTKTATGIVSSPTFARPYLYFIHVDEAGKVLYNRPSTETRIASYAPDGQGTFFAFEERRFEFHDAAGGSADHVIGLGTNKNETEAVRILNTYMLSWINSRFNPNPAP
ncbi:MAG: hypothetical protein JWO78_2482 [Micavibrio sp.]|nr:hypothetical protein [Micavibrio sp.]